MIKIVKGISNGNTIDECIKEQNNRLKQWKNKMMDKKEIKDDIEDDIDWLIYYNANKKNQH